jgi:hypothetical protein
VIWNQLKGSVTSINELFEGLLVEMEVGTFKVVFMMLWFLIWRK